MAGAAAAMLVAAAAPPSSAHSLQDLERQLYDREPFFQPLDSSAPDFVLQDADGRPVRLADFRGKAVVLHFIYTACPDECPLHADKLAEVQSMAKLAGLADRVEFISITTDPERDTPEVLREYGAAHGLDAASWVFLTSGAGQPEATRRLAEAFGHKFKLVDDALQLHGIVTHVIDRAGRLKANFHGLQFQSVHLVQHLNALVDDTPHGHEPPRKSWWQRLREAF